MALSQEEVDRLVAEAKEEVRAKCEAIARKLAEVNKRNNDTNGWLACEDVAEDIAALKGNGEGR